MATAGSERNADEPPSLALGALHLFTLSSLAIAQPLLDVLARAPEFFLAQRLGWVEIVLAAVVACALIPVVLTAIELLLGMLSWRSRVLAHRVFVTALLTLHASLILQRVPSLPASAQLAGAGMLGIALGIAYARSAHLRSFVTVLAPAIVVVPAMFLFASPIANVLRPTSPRPVLPAAPQPYSVVMVVFDEFATGSLLDEHHEIDRQRYPNLAALAQEATWFRNATTVANVTQAAVAALLTGRYPALDPLAVPDVHASNLFTVLAGSHTLDVHESYVPFCPLDLCPQPATEARRRRHAMLWDLGIVLAHVVTPESLRGSLPDVSVPLLMLRPGRNLGALDARIVAAQHEHRGTDDPGYRARLLDDFVTGIEARESPALHYLHVLLPHEPSMHLPSGRSCAPDVTREPIVWGEHIEPARRAQVRHLMQVELVDAFVGRLVARLKDSGRWDSTILVLTGDHGVSYRPGQPRRAISPENLCDIIAVPLIVKLPRQTSGGISDVNAESVDVLPTILEALGATPPWPTDGRALSGDSAERPVKTLVGPFWGPLEKTFFPDGEPVSIGPRLDRECLGVERKITLVGSGKDRRALYAADFPELVGARVADLPVSATDASARSTLDDPAAFEHVGVDAAVVPCTIRGRVEGAVAADTLVAVAINGVVRAVTPIEPERSGGARLVATVDEASFAAGRNEVELLLVDDGPDGVTLVRVPPADRPGAAPPGT